MLAAAPLPAAVSAAACSFVDSCSCSSPASARPAAAWMQQAGSKPAGEVVHVQSRAGAGAHMAGAIGRLVWLAAGSCCHSSSCGSARAGCWCWCPVAAVVLVLSLLLLLPASLVLARKGLHTASRAAGAAAGASATAVCLLRQSRLLLLLVLRPCAPVGGRVPHLLHAGSQVRQVPWSRHMRGGGR